MRFPRTHITALAIPLLLVTAAACHGEVICSAGSCGGAPSDSCPDNSDCTAGILAGGVISVVAPDTLEVELCLGDFCDTGTVAVDTKSTTCSGSLGCTLSPTVAGQAALVVSSNGFDTPGPKVGDVVRVRVISNGTGETLLEVNITVASVKPSPCEGLACESASLTW